MSDKKRAAHRSAEERRRANSRRKRRGRRRQNYAPLACLIVLALVILAAAGTLMMTAPRRSHAVIKSQNIRPRQALAMAEGDDARQVVILAPAMTEASEPEVESPEDAAQPDSGTLDSEGADAGAETAKSAGSVDSETEATTPDTSETSTTGEANAAETDADGDAADTEAEATLARKNADIEAVIRQTAADITAKDEGFLPVYKKADTMEPRIAITVDDCFQVKNLQTIAKTAYKAGGKLTLFPIGETMVKKDMPETLKICAFKLGFEIENHTWSHARIFRLPPSQMASEIWNQSQTLNRVLGVNYRQHFFRLMGGDGSTDQRTHRYLKKLGFKGIADWTVSGSDSSLEQIKQSLQPGAIYLFHTTDGDTQKLMEFIPYAVEQGYQLVTLNELLGFDENTVSQYQVTAMPSPDASTDDYRLYQQGEYAWNIVQLQDRLRTLGYLEMEGASTGYFGEQTAEAVMAYQKAEGLPITGVADSETQRRLVQSSRVT